MKTLIKFYCHIVILIIITASCQTETGKSEIKSHFDSIYYKVGQTFNR